MPEVAKLALLNVLTVKVMARLTFYSEYQRTAGLCGAAVLCARQASLMSLLSDYYLGYFTPSN